MSRPLAEPPRRVSLAPPRERAAAPHALAGGGPAVILGAQSECAPIRPDARSLFGPRGATVTADGCLWVADTGHHRLLGWPARPAADGAAAGLLLGQRDAGGEARNAGGAVEAGGFAMPTGLCAVGEGLAVADAWNHRVLLWRRAPRRSGQPPDLVLGQGDFRAGAINRGRPGPDADTLYWPYAVHYDGQRLWVADTGNRRVLRWDRLPGHHGTPADAVLGQPDFRQRDENAGAVGAGSLRWPHALAHWRGALVIADAGNNRVLCWRQAAPPSGCAADAVLGQADFHGLDHNRGHYWPTAGSLNMPYGLAVLGEALLVADTANSRLLRYDTFGPATALAGQAGFADKGDNRWQRMARDTLCWPYAVAAHGDTAIVVDSGNNRVLLWPQR
ncbi:NHL repeat-containing protein [Frateuria defendens]|uniref:NHL repeat-containing protein n=1 Tax=Frateuria defendens TaxID=2219559 RepID=UPI000ABDCDC4|nr:NHL repeat-containing protein [Frateuria defendens]